MKTQRSFGEQLLQMLLVGAGVWLLFNLFFGPNADRRDGGVPPRPALALSQAFAGIDPAAGPLLDEANARAQVRELRTQIEANPGDPLAHWSQLRIGLIQQYVLGELESSTRRGFMGFGGPYRYFPIYDEVINSGLNDSVQVQAMFQSGDLLWRRSLQANGAVDAQGVGGLESIVRTARSNRALKNQPIYVPAAAEPAAVPLEGVPPQGFRVLTLSELSGTVENPNPQGVLDRVNAYYADSNLYRLIDGVVQLYGANPAFSYGLALLTFAIATRVVMQPIYRRQYDSMKGMAVIAPEMKKIQERYKGKTDQASQMKMMKEVRGLQQRHGVNPALGCGLALLQMPIFFFFVYPMIQHYEPKMEIANASFLWINALSRPDIPLLVLYAASMFLSFRLSSTPPADDTQRQQQMIMGTVLPLVFPIFLFAYPSAFTLYWAAYNLISTAFQWRMIKAADPQRDLVKTLMGADLRVANPTADAVPSHPSKAATRDSDPDAQGAAPASTSSTNGASSRARKNGRAALPSAPEAALNGTRDDTQGEGLLGVEDSEAARPARQRVRGKKKRAGGTQHHKPENAVLSPLEGEHESRP